MYKGNGHHEDHFPSTEDTDCDCEVPFVHEVYLKSLKYEDNFKKSNSSASKILNAKITSRARCDSEVKTPLTKDKTEILITIKTTNMDQFSKQSYE